MKTNLEKAWDAETSQTSQTGGGSAEFKYRISELDGTADFANMQIPRHDQFKRESESSSPARARVSESTKPKQETSPIMSSRVINAASSLPRETSPSIPTLGTKDAPVIVLDSDSGSDAGPSKSQLRRMIKDSDNETDQEASCFPTVDFDLTVDIEILRTLLLTQEQQETEEHHGGILVSKRSCQ